jgi:hypothetical protein
MVILEATTQDRIQIFADETRKVAPTTDPEEIPQVMAERLERVTDAITRSPARRLPT